MCKLQLSSITLIVLSSLLVACNDSDSKKNMDTEVVNSAPSAEDAMVTTQTETVINDMLEGSDPDGDTLTFSE